MLAYDTLESAKRLKAAGADDVLAEAVAVEIKLARQDLIETLATKEDLKQLELRLKYDLTLRLGGMLAAGIGIVAALVKLL